MRNRNNCYLLYVISLRNTVNIILWLFSRLQRITRFFRPSARTPFSRCRICIHYTQIHIFFSSASKRSISRTRAFVLATRFTFINRRLNIFTKTDGKFRRQTRSSDSTQFSIYTDARVSVTLLARLFSPPLSSPRTGISCTCIQCVQYISTSASSLTG